jgi:fumarylacetoacetate (FAA) hydrolase family protein
MSARAAVLDLAATLPQDSDKALLVGRLWQPGVGPVVVACHAGALHDLSHLAATTSQLFELDDPAAAVRAALAGAPRIAEFAAVLANSDEALRKSDQAWLLAPNDLQVVKASGVTFIESLLERVIEEQARGDASKAEGIRQALTGILGANLAGIMPGSAEAERVKLCTAPARSRRSAAIRWTSCRRPSVRTISIQTASCCSWARCSHRRRTAMARDRASPTKWEMW